MKLLVFGASGGTGKLVVQQALEKGYQVSAFVRNPERFNVVNPALHIVKGDVLQPATIADAMPGHDAVICCIGAPANKAFQIRSEGTKNILSAMKIYGVDRFICQTSLGFADSKIILRNTSFVFRNIIVPVFLKTSFADHAIQEGYIQKSGVNWTIVRPGNMTNTGFTGNYQHGFDYTNTAITVQIARADVAAFMLEQLADNRYSRRTTGISY